jgi:hypothetical protein
MVKGKQFHIYGYSVFWTHICDVLQVVQMTSLLYERHQSMYYNLRK